MLMSIKYELIIYWSKEDDMEKVDADKRSTTSCSLISSQLSLIP